VNQDTTVEGAQTAPIDGIDDPAITTYGRIIEVARRLDREFGASYSAAGLPDAHFEVLLRLGRPPDEQMTMSELASQLGITTGGATRLVDRVAADGFVERRACSYDRRISYVGFTSAGRDKLAEILAVHREDLRRELSDRLRPDEIAALDAILDRLR
jgi:MarR family transcriptional regulator, 2-MHQ and catechol-resistance regulon repressor